MLRRQLPSANSLFTFEAVARLESFSGAAAELNVTQPAVSRSINGLEAHLGYPLFKRHGRWISLTANGDKLFRATTTAFNGVTDSLRDIDQQHEDREIVTISMSSTGVNYWFIPRIFGFKQKFPSVELEFRAFSREGVGSQHDFDLGIRLSNPLDADMHRWFFSDERILALCAPKYVLENGTLDKPRKGRSHNLIEQVDQRYSLDEFFHSTGQSPPDSSSIIKFSDYSSILQAAIQGEGIALAWVTDASLQVIEGRLVPACTQVVKTGRRFHIVASNLKPMRPVVEDVRDWLMTEMRNDQKRVASTLSRNWNLFSE
ncbi:MAG: LysR family transcriptional regulator [Rhodobacteraceae bacterium]|nr:LysR family transcriptional regulator [Paracoccaceae bacterium]